MSHTRLYVEHRLGPGAELGLGVEAARYLGRVLRLQAGDVLSVFNGDDGEWRASILAIGKDRVALQVGEALVTNTESTLRIHLVQGISRGERMDFVVQKATELGVERITPVLTDHGTVRLDAARAAKRRDHWQRVARSACEQSGRTRRMAGFVFWLARKAASANANIKTRAWPVFHRFRWDREH